MFIPSEAPPVGSTVATPTVSCGRGDGSGERTSPGASPTNPSSENLEKYTKLVETCYRRGTPSETELHLLETFQKKYGISPDNGPGHCRPSSAPQDTIEQAAAEFGLMFRAFLDNDGEIDLEEQAQLLELQEELGLTNEQVETIETNIRGRTRSCVTDADQRVWANRKGNPTHLPGLSKLLPLEPRSSVFKGRSGIFSQVEQSDSKLNSDIHFS